MTILKNTIITPYKLRNKRLNIAGGTLGGSTSLSIGGSSSDSLFELRTDPNGTPYIFTNLDLISAKEITAYSSNDAVVSSLWDDMPVATDTTIGGIILGTGLTIDENGVVSVLGGIGNQTLSFANNILSISDGNSVDLSGLSPDLSGYATETWVNANFAPATINVDGLSDVTITSILSGEILKWNGTVWVNNTLAEAGISAVGHTHTIANVTGLQTALDGKAASTHSHGNISNTGTVGTTANLPLITGTGGAVQTTTTANLKSLLSITKSDVGLGNVDNTSDASKPISTATQTALDGKASSTHVHGNIKNNGAIGTTANLPIITTTSGVLTTTSTTDFKLKLALTKSDVGLANVDNTSDLNKPISTATQNALNLKLNKSVWDENFEIVNAGLSNEYIRAKKSLASVGDITAFNGDALSGSIWDSMPAATTTTLGGIKVGSGLLINSGVLSVDGDTFNLTNYYTKTESDNKYVPYTGATQSVNLGAYNLTGTQLISTIADGTAPLIVTSTTKVANLNADRVDDIEAERIIYGDNNTGTSRVSDLNTIDKSGFYFVPSGTTGTPTVSAYNVIHSNYDAGAAFGFQIASLYNSSLGRFYMREELSTGGNWSDWRELYHTGNLDITSFPKIYGSAWNTALGGNYIGFNSHATDAPIASVTHFGIVAQLGSNTNYTGALVMRNNKIFFQTKENGTLQGWNELYHTGNFIAGTHYQAPHSVSNNYILKSNGLGGIIQSNINDDGTNVGIGTTATAYKLSVNGDVDANYFNSDGGILGFYVPEASTLNKVKIKTNYTGNNYIPFLWDIKLASRAALNTGGVVNIHHYSYAGQAGAIDYFIQNNNLVQEAVVYYDVDGYLCLYLDLTAHRVFLNVSLSNRFGTKIISSEWLTDKPTDLNYQTTFSINTIRHSGNFTAGTHYQAPLTNPVTGTGTTNYLPKWTGLGTLGNSQIYDDETNVGIGTTAPLAKLDIVHLNNTARLRIADHLTSDNYSVRIDATTNYANQFNFYVGNDLFMTKRSGIINILNYNDIDFQTYTTTPNSSFSRLRILQNGNVGINTTSPLAKLDIQASVSNEKLFRLSHPTSPTQAGFYIGFNSNGTTDDAAVSLGVELSDVEYDALTIDRTTRNVGIGTTTPTEKLDVNGNIKAVGITSTGVIDYKAQLKQNSISFQQLSNFAQYGNNNSSVAGSIRIEIPITSSVMWDMKVKIIEYQSSSPSTMPQMELTIGAYTTTNSRRVVYGTGGIDRLTQVRFGRNVANTKTVILIDKGTSWAYPKVIIDEIVLHHTGSRGTLLDPSTYSVSVTTDETDFTLSGTISKANFFTEYYTKSETDGKYASLTGLYADPSWITSLAGSKISGNISGNAATATKLSSIATTFTGTYPLTVNVNGTIYSHTNMTYNGTGGILTAPWFSGDLLGIATNASNIEITDTDTTGIYYPVFVGGTSGYNAARIQDAKLAYNTSTGAFTSTTFIGDGSNLTSLSAGNLTGTIPSAVLGNSSVYLGTTAVALNRSSAALTLNGVTSQYASNVYAIAATNNAEYYPTFVSGSSAGQKQVRIDTQFLGLTYNPYYARLTALNVASSGIVTDNITSVNGTISALKFDTIKDSPIQIGTGSNILKSSNSFTGTGWVGTNAAIVSSYTESPFSSSLLGSLISYQTAATYSLKQTIASTTTGAYTLSAWVKGTAGNTVTFKIGYNTSSVGLTQNVTLTADWQRVSFTYTYGSHTSKYIDISATSSVSSFYLYGVQFEQGSEAGVYVETGSTFVSTVKKYVNAYTDLLVRGNITASSEVTAYSDSRLKNEIGNTPDTLDKVNQVRVVDYTLKDDSTHKQRTGVIAQELIDVFPQFVSGSNEDYYSVNYAGMVSVALKAIQELTKEVKELKAEINHLKNK